MRRHNFRVAADDDSLPVMVPRNDKAVVPISLERVRRLRKHLVVTLRSLRTAKNPKHSGSRSPAAIRWCSYSIAIRAR
jgi:hypothetical protein